MDQQGMLVDGFKEESMFITIYNHPYYVQHLEKLGYGKDIDWMEFKVTIPKEADERMNKLSEAVLKRSKITLVEVKSRSEIKAYIPQVLGLLNICYSHLYGTVNLTEAQIQKYVNEYIMLINPEYVKLLVDENKELIGFGLGMPSLSKAVKKSGGRLFPFGWYHIMRAPYAKTKILDLYLVGVLPKYQNKGLTAVLLNSMSASARKNGLMYAETGPELETNHQVQSL
ncbi:MAG: hypothetical protein K0R00_4103, partial [Herbinix sp.]|nr:hypothetical protein [Herbinix sp.]